MIFQNAADPRGIGNATTLRGADDDSIKQRVL
jgi:hypothetical protein